MLPNINFHIWFKVAKPIKRKYKLSTNCTLVLNGAYLLQSINNKPYTQRQLRDFVCYYDLYRLQAYITVLISKSFLIKAESNNTRDYFVLSSLGLSVIKELNESYEIELRKFIDLYSIVL